jgi:hypothetical protein
VSSRTVVQLRGGIGNQLFQYAAGRVVAENTDTQLLLDASFIKAEGHRDYALARFGITNEVVDYDFQEQVGLYDIEGTAAWGREHFGAETLRELGHDFHDQLKSAPPDSYLVGYWQSEQNLEAISDELRSELGPSQFAGFSRAGRALSEEIQAARESVAVHVRRGDYVSNPEMVGLFGSKSMEYFYAAAEKLAEIVAAPKFFVFSDDPEWCARELILPGPQQVLSGETTAEEDLALIGTCRHAVISNSSFSWWGAWLGEQPDSVIVAPADYFNSSRIAQSHVVPDRWLRA